MLRKRKISTGIPPTEFEERKTAVREDPVREMDRTHREHPVRIVRQAEETDSVRLPVRMDPVRIVRRSRAAGNGERRTEDHRKDARQETDVRKRDREAVSVKIVGQMEETGSVRSSAPNGQRGNRRQDEGARNGQRPDSRRNDRNDRNDRNSIPSPLVEQQKPQRQ